MRLPGIIVSCLSKKWLSKYVQHTWNTKPDSSIIKAFNDSTGWINIAVRSRESSILTKIADACEAELEGYIMPQMRKRNLLSSMWFVESTAESKQRIDNVVRTEVRRLIVTDILSRGRTK